ncbi:MAG: hypothetical protein EBQ63_04965, partial [Actinobacteria bacterium]|nr:hypothetical protein [Actinomycetota bacterium]
MVELDLPSLYRFNRCLQRILWLVRNAPISLTSTYAYVNPVIAVALGVIFLNEKINLSYVLGGGVVILGVLLVVTNEG